jgi:NAD(P)H-flavin reductase
VVVAGPPAIDTAWWLPRADLDRLITLLREDGRTVIGPTLRDDAVVYAEITSTSDLPRGVRDEQAPGRYRLTQAPQDGSERWFAFAASPTSWKAFTFPASVPLARVRRDGDGVVTHEESRHDVQPMAFLGMRACDLAALGIHDDVLQNGTFVDEDYAARRAAVLRIAVECATPSGTCFCASMGTGPEVSGGYDLALTELADGFLARVGSEQGSALVARLGLAVAAPDEQVEASAVVAAARRVLDGQSGVATEGLHDRLLARLDDPGWSRIAERCLACTNCTMACPTCFCTSVTLVSDLLGAETETHREWTSCFTLDFARVAGGNFRPRVEDRYRQWLTHKFATWIDQFGTFGCVGCGRCITWCPVGIDVREELAAIAPLQPPPVAVAPSPRAPSSAARYAIGVVTAIEPETGDTYTLAVDDLPSSVCHGAPGQFVMLELPGFSAVPISVSRFREAGIDLTIRSTGASTAAITALRPGSQIGLRGPLGRGWPLGEVVGRDVFIVAGGIGLAPLRPLIEHCLAARSGIASLRIFYGARTPADLLFVDEIDGWRQREGVSVAITVDRADASWTGPVGVVTQLFDRERFDAPHSVAFMCGPEKMMSASWLTLAGRGLMPEQVYLSMERRMECGIGLCGHCQLGPNFICKDGPVFSRRDLGAALDVEGL